MSEMVERVALVIFESLPPGRGKSSHQLIAREVIAAMREPTEEMIGITDADEFDVVMWKEMIDAALRNAS